MTGLPGPAVCARVTALPLTGLPWASLRVTVTVEVVVPSAGTVEGLAPTVLWDESTAPVVNDTEGVCSIDTPSVVSVAWKVSVPAVVELTVNVTTPPAVDGPDAELIVGPPGPELLTRDTVLPLIGLSLTSLRVTVMVEVVLPSASALPGLGVAVLGLRPAEPAGEVT